MFLPVKAAIDLPLIPALDKESIPALAAFIGCRLVAKKRIPFFGQSGLVRWMLLLFLVGPFLTAELNSDAVIVGGHRLPPLQHYDALSAVINQLITILPFFLGRQLFRTYDDQLLMFRTLIIAGLFYSILILIEVRMSPQLHRWVYGYSPHGFAQQMRYGSFRAVVFMGHGLWVAFFVAVTVLAASVFWRLKIKIWKFSSAGITFYLLAVLLLCKSIASLLYGFSAFLMIKIAPLKMQLHAARILVLIALLYPTLSIINLVPHKAIMDFVTSIDAERAQSLGVRFNNEHQLLDHARKRFLFGWGGWGRNRVYSEETGDDVSITDGRWIITFGTFGYLGFFVEFGLMALPVFRALSVYKFIKSKQELILLSANALLIGVIMIDQLPNGSLASWLWLIVGTMLGRVENVFDERRKNKIQYT